MGFTLLGILNSQAVGGGGEQPAFLSSAPLWLDAADATTITESSGSVSQWSNKGTLGHFTQASATFQPTTNASTINGLNVLDFNRDAIQYDGLKSDFTFMHNGTSYFSVFVMNFANENKEFFCSARGNTSSIGIQTVALAANDELISFIFNGSGTGVLDFRDTRELSTTTAIYSTNFDPDNGTAAERAEGFVNNSIGLKNNTNTGTPTSSDPFTSMIIGTGPDLSGNVQSGTAILGQVAEMIVVSGVDATETNRQAVVDYLNTKWGIF